MIDIESLAAEKVRLEQTLMAYAMWNISGKSLEELAKAESNRIETQRRLNEVNRQIIRYEQGQEETR